MGTSFDTQNYHIRLPHIGNVPNSLSCHQIAMQANSKPYTKNWHCNCTLCQISAILLQAQNFLKRTIHKDFEKCYEAGANSDNSQYLKMYHPNSTLLSDCSFSGSPLPDSPLPDSPLSDSYQPAFKLYWSFSVFQSFCSILSILYVHSQVQKTFKEKVVKRKNKE